MARSRYFSRISSSVAGIPPTGFTPRPGSPCPCKSLPAAPRDRLGHLAPPGGRGERPTAWPSSAGTSGPEPARNAGKKAWRRCPRRAAIRGTPRARRSRACVIRTAPSPWATCASVPAPPTIRYLPAKRTASSLKAGIAIRGLKTSIASMSDDDREHVLVVGHRVHAVERVRDVDEPALAADLGDRLLERHPARDLLVDEEADDLALVGGLDLLADDHLDAVLGGLGARVVRAGDLVVVGDRDRAQADVAGGGEQHVDRRRAVVGVVGVHVQVDLDQLALRDPRADLGLRVRVVAQRGQARVDRLDLVGDLATTRAPRAPAAPRRDELRRAGRRRGSARSSCAASTSTSPTWKCRPEVAVAQDLLVDRHARGERHRTGAERPHQHAGRGDLAERGRDDDVGAGERGVLVVDDVHAVAQAGAQRRDARRSSSRRRPPTAAPPGSSRSARRNSRSAPRSSRSENAIRSGPPSGAPRAPRRVTPGPQQLVGRPGRSAFSSSAVAS